VRGVREEETKEEEGKEKIQKPEANESQVDGCFA